MSENEPMLLDETAVSAQTPRAFWFSFLSTAYCKYSHKISTRATGTYAVHDHPYYEMMYVISGQVDFFIAGHVFPIGGGTLVTFPPGARHGVLVRTSAPYERYTMHFDPRALSMERRRLLLHAIPKDLLGFASEEQSGAAVWRGMENSGMMQVLEAIETLRDADPSTQEAVLPIYLEALLATLIPRTAQPQAGSSASRRALSQQEEIVSWVDQHYTEPITLDSLAEHFYLSKGYLSTQFRQATGKSVKDYVRARRVAHVQMLLSTGLPPAQAAARVGFADYTTFYRAYVRTVGHAPSADCKSGISDAPLAEALGAPLPLKTPGGGAGPIVYPIDGTANEDPSMEGVVIAEPAKK